ncbi:MAG: nucleotidyltransferase domain-containing protein [Chitinophagaceae bacterium]
MHEIIENNKFLISEVCKKHHVKSLHVFGSARRATDFTDTSDVDLLVTFESLPTVTNDEIFYKVENCDQLHKNLELVLKRKIDLLQEASIKNKFLKYFINKEKKLLYGLS